MTKSSKGFTLTEFIIGILILALAMGILIPNTGCMANYIKAREKAKEAETKANLHSIQIAIERFGMDHGGEYPYMLYGGDKSDTFVTVDSPPPPDSPDYEYWEGDVDILISENYLNSYHENAFAQSSSSQILTDPAACGFGPLEINPARVNIWATPRDRGKEYIRRKVGGERGNLMWDVSEGQRHPPWPIIVRPPPAPSTTGFINPPDNPGKDNFRDDHQTIWTPGNFYYYARISGPGGYSAFMDTDSDGIGEVENPIEAPVIGYELACYGTLFNPGLDVYNLYGDYAENELMTIPDADAYGFGKSPDGRRDGVILVLSSGLEKGPLVDWG